MAKKSAFLLLEVVIALALLVGGVAVSMHLMALLTKQHAVIHKKLMSSYA